MAFPVSQSSPGFSSWRAQKCHQKDESASTWLVSKAPNDWKFHCLFSSSHTHSNAKCNPFERQQFLSVPGVGEGCIQRQHSVGTQDLSRERRQSKNCNLNSSHCHSFKVSPKNTRGHRHDLLRVRVIAFQPWISCVRCKRKINSKRKSS